MINPGHKRPVSDHDLELMGRVDRLHLEHPFAGARMLRDLLNQDGLKVGRKHVATLMRKMGIQALYRKPNTSKRGKRHKIYPYLLRGLEVNRANQVWALARYGKPDNFNTDQGCQFTSQEFTGLLRDRYTDQYGREGLLA